MLKGEPRTLGLLQAVFAEASFLTGTLCFFSEGSALACTRLPPGQQPRSFRGSRAYSEKVAQVWARPIKVAQAEVRQRLSEAAAHNWHISTLKGKAKSLRRSPGSGTCKETEKTGGF